MKIRVKVNSVLVAPKQIEGRVVIGNEEFAAVPKPSGLIISKAKNKSVVKTDEQIGVVLYQKRDTKILKQTD